MIKLETSGISSQVIDVLEKQGLPVKRFLSIDIPQIPDDITMVEDADLMDMAVKFMENYNFLLTQVTCAELVIAEQENNLEVEEAKLLLSLTNQGAKLTAAAVKATISTNEDIVESRTELLHAKAYHKLLKTMLDNAERSYQLTSRELTRRTSLIKSKSF